MSRFFSFDFVSAHDAGALASCRCALRLSHFALHFRPILYDIVRDFGVTSEALILITGAAFA